MDYRTVHKTKIYIFLFNRFIFVHMNLCFKQDIGHVKMEINDVDRTQCTGDLIING